MKDRTKNRLVEAVVTSLVFAVLGYWHYLHQVELKRRGIWMDGVNQFRTEVESRTVDRWTKTDHEKWAKALLENNPQLTIPEE